MKHVISPAKLRFHVCHAFRKTIFTFPISMFTTHSTLYIFKSRDTPLHERKKNKCTSRRRCVRAGHLENDLHKFFFPSNWDDVHSFLCFLAADKTEHTRRVRGSDVNETLRCHELLSSILHQFGSFLLRKIIKFTRRFTTQFEIWRFFFCCNFNTTLR